MERNSRETASPWMRGVRDIRAMLLQWFQLGAELEAVSLD
jgi:hypothetical protein